MSTSETGAMPASQPSMSNGQSGQDVSWTDLGHDLWAYLTGRGAAINYSFVDMEVEVPRDTGPDAPRATWRLNGTLRVTTSDDEYSGADPLRS